MKKQIILIHGGVSHKDWEDYYERLKNKKYSPYEEKEKTWRYFLDEKLPEFEYISPAMPDKSNADYHAWKIWFEKVLPYINNENTILIGWSLGGLFVSKYFSENNFPKKLNQLHIVSPVFDNSGLSGESVGNFELENFEGLRDIENKAEKIFLYHSRDDFVVPYEHAEKYLEYLPSAQFMSFDDRGHFLQAEFPELIENIKNNI